METTPMSRYRMRSQMQCYWIANQETAPHFAEQNLVRELVQFPNWCERSIKTRHVPKSALKLPHFTISTTTNKSPLSLVYEVSKWNKAEIRLRKQYLHICRLGVHLLYKSEQRILHKARFQACSHLVHISSSGFEQHHMRSLVALVAGDDPRARMIIVPQVCDFFSHFEGNGQGVLRAFCTSSWGRVGHPSLANFVTFLLGLQEPATKNILEKNQNSLLYNICLTFAPRVTNSWLASKDTECIRNTQTPFYVVLLHWNTNFVASARAAGAIGEPKLTLVQQFYFASRAKISRFQKTAHCLPLLYV